MCRYIFYIVVAWLASGIGGVAWAAEPALPKTILLIEFGEASPPGSKLNDAIQQAQKEFPALQHLALPDERALESTLEKKTDENIGMVVLMHPQDSETVHKYPSLYPDIAFTVIDMPNATFATNVQTVQFKEEEGTFMLGAIAAIRDNGHIAVLGLGNDERTQMLADHFMAGAKYMRPEVALTMLLNIQPALEQPTRISSAIAEAFKSGASIIFSMDREIIEPALHAAKPERKMVISGVAPGEKDETSRLLTYMVKRYDLALLDVLHIYAHNQWRPGSILLGVQGGYIDYALNSENVDLFPKEAIDQIEATKDYIGQGIVSRAP